MCLDSVTVNPQYISKSKELSLPVKQAIIRLKNLNKPNREMAKTLGLAKSTICSILKMKELTDELRNTKKPGRPQKTAVVKDRRILSQMKKKPSQQLARSITPSRR